MPQILVLLAGITPWYLLVAPQNSHRLESSLWWWVWLCSAVGGKLVVPAQGAALEVENVVYVGLIIVDCLSPFHSSGRGLKGAAPARQSAFGDSLEGSLERLSRCCGCAGE